MTPIEPVAVHLQSSDVPFSAHRQGRRGVYYTITLSTNEAAENLLPASGGRKIAFIVPLDQAVVIGANKSDVGNGTGTIIPQNIAWPVDDDQALYVAPSPAVTGGTTARVSVSATYEDP